MLAAGVLLLSSVSCGMVEMRDSEQEVEQADDTAALTIMPAERKNTVETRAETETTAVQEEPAAVVNFVLTGDIRIDESIINDAANRAADGNNYSFVRMYTGIFNQINSADIAMGSYSTADVPFGSDDDVEEIQKTPVESLAALSDAGYDILDTSGAANDPDEMSEYGTLDLDKADSNLQYIEKNGLNFAFVSAGDDAQETLDTVEYADFTSDFVIVSVNWADGIDDSAKKAIAQNLAEAGADIIAGDGNILGAVEWLSTSDGSKTLAAYSLGNILSASDDPYELCGGILEFSVTSQDGVIEIKDVILEPTVVRYTEGGNGYQLVLLADYNTHLSADHAVQGADADTLIPFVRETVAVDFLTPKLRGNAN